jgi:ABC-type multidrug transport system ATPase subunit
MSHMVMRDCGYTVTLKKGKVKPLLTGVTANVEAGHVLAILGPSGAGKTTLLNMLTLEKKGGRPTGILTLNGQALTLAMYKAHCAYVQQNDALWASLTAREHMDYAYALFQPGVDTAARSKTIDEVLGILGLTDSQHVKAGNQFFRGLSGGLKRRLSIGLALAKKPLVVCLDEPTTGVDSASAAMMMTFLKKIADEQTIAIVCTIHQPPAAVFHGFDDLIVLASGRTAYFGAADKMGEYFASFGHVPPPEVNM